LDKLFFMSIKEQVLQMVSAIEDEKLLELVKADIEYFNASAAILDDLSDKEKEELLSMVNEPDQEDTLTEEEYKAATAKWRTK
jgi:hypothetical protein